MVIIIMFNNHFSPVILVADVSKLLTRLQFTSPNILAVLQ